MASFISNRFKYELASGKVNWAASSQFKAILCYTTFSGTPDQDYVGDLTTLGEVTGTGYTSGYSGSGRKTITGTLVQDETNDRAVLKIANLTWTAIDVGATSCAGVLIYMHGIAHTGGTASSDANAPVVAWLEFSASKRTNGEDFTVQFDQTNGAITIS